MYVLHYCQHRLWRIVLLSSACYFGNAQTKVLKGVIRDEHSEERIPFASIHFRNSGGVSSLIQQVILFSDLKVLGQRIHWKSPM